MNDDCPFYLTGGLNKETLTDFFDVLSGIPNKDSLLLVDALLFAVYGWTPEKVKRMKLTSIRRWLEYAKKRMTWGDALKLNMLLEKKKEPLWKMIISKIKR